MPSAKRRTQAASCIAVAMLAVLCGCATGKSHNDAVTVQSRTLPTFDGKPFSRIAFYSNITNLIVQKPAEDILGAALRKRGVSCLLSYRVTRSEDPIEAFREMLGMLKRGRVDALLFNHDDPKQSTESQLMGGFKLWARQNGAKVIVWEAQYFSRTSSIEDPIQDLWPPIMRKVANLLFADGVVAPQAKGR